MNVLWANIFLQHHSSQNTEEEEEKNQQNYAHNHFQQITEQKNIPIS